MKIKVKVVHQCITFTFIFIQSRKHGPRQEPRSKRERYLHYQCQQKRILYSEGTSAVSALSETEPTAKVELSTATRGLSASGPWRI